MFEYKKTAANLLLIGPDAPEIVEINRLPILNLELGNQIAEGSSSALFYVGAPYQVADGLCFSVKLYKPDFARKSKNVPAILNEAALWQTKYPDALAPCYRLYRYQLPNFSYTLALVFPERPHNFMLFDRFAGPINQKDLLMVLKLIHQLQQDLVRIHSLGVAHRDIKYANIATWFTSDNCAETIAEYIDYGSATPLPGLPIRQYLDWHGKLRDFTIPDTPYMGTWSYQSSESFHTRDVDWLTADIFSFSVLLYQLLTRADPYPALFPLVENRSLINFVKLIRKTRADNPPQAVSEHNTTLRQLLTPNTLSVLESWINAGLKGDPTQRQALVSLAKVLAQGIDELSLDQPRDKK